MSQGLQNGAWGRGGLAAVNLGGAGQEVEQGGTVQVARMVHDTYWVHIYGYEGTIYP